MNEERGLAEQHVGAAAASKRHNDVVWLRARMHRWILLAALLVWATPGWAGQGDVAKALFEKGVTFFEAGNTERALDYFLLSGATGDCRQHAQRRHLLFATRSSR